MEYNHTKESHFKETDVQSVSLWTAQQWKKIMDTTSPSK